MATPFGRKGSGRRSTRSVELPPPAGLNISSSAFLSHEKSLSPSADESESARCTAGGELLHDATPLVVADDRVLLTSVQPDSSLLSPTHTELSRLVLDRAPPGGRDDRGSE